MRDLDSEMLHELNARKHCNIYRKGSAIFHQGNTPMGMFSVFSGKVKLFKTDDLGKEQIIRLAKPGDSIGYRSLLSGEAYHLGAEALEDTRACFIPKALFSDLMNKGGNMFTHIIKLLSEDLKQAEHRIAALAGKPVRERTAEALLVLRNFYGTTDDGVTIDIAISREDLAQMVGTATESVIRMLSEFKADHLIEIKHKNISVTNLSGLEKVANVQD
ncbi:MAG: Crp/Fnr family transcriptional regulator [Bacteroidota bacterium]